jgi:hypothetical protein
LLGDLEHAAQQFLKYISDSDEQEDAVEEVMGFYCQVKSKRYLSRPKTYKKIKLRSERWFQQWVSDTRFVLYCKMSRRSFDWILNRVRNHEVFKSGLSHNRQRSVQYQLFVGVARLCQDGSAATGLRVADLFKLGYGTVELITKRVLTALKSLEPKFVLWPDRNRRRILSAIGEDNFGFPGYCVNVDGTLLGLARAPAFNMRPETYCHPRHRTYGFNTLLFTDHLNYIVSYVFGWPGAASDSTIMASSFIAQEPHKYLAIGEEFIFADLGFKRENYVVTPFKGEQAALRHNQMFNRAQRTGRCRIEHVNGCLKARFASLRAMPIDIKCKEDVADCHLWVSGCIVLYNILVWMKDEYDFAQPPEEEDELQFTEDEVANVSGKAMQEMVRDRWLRSQGWVDA